MTESRAVAPVVESVALAAWLGASLVVAAVVAPAAFSVLPSRTLAGALVGRVLSPLCWAGIVVPLGVIGATIARRATRSTGRLVALVVAAVACGTSQLVLRPRIAVLRDAIGVPVDTLAVDDARRVAFGLLHALSVGCLAIAMVAAAVALLMTIARVRSQPANAALLA